MDNVYVKKGILRVLTRVNKKLYVYKVTNMKVKL